MADVIQKYYEKLFDLMLTGTGKVSVSQDFHGQMKQINTILRNDKSALVSTILDYMVNSATIDINFETENSNLQKVFVDWKKNVNANVSIDMPKGLRNFTQQYFRERWKSSFIVIRIIWGKNKDGFVIPTKIWVMDGSSIFVNNNVGSLNTCEYFLGKPSENKNNILKNTNNETIFVRKPNNCLYDIYPTPYLVKRGTLYHSLFKEQTLNRQVEIINTAFPYQFFIKVGTEEAMRKGQMPSEAELQNLLAKFQDKKTDFETHPYSKGLAGAFPFDVNFEEIMPDYLKALDEKILKGTDKNILNSLGMIELKGFSSTREEAILNPKVLIEEVTSGVGDYVSLLQEITDLTIEKNSNKYKINTPIEVTPGVIESFITDEMRTFLRSLYDRGIVSYEDSLESTTPLKFKTQVIKRKKEIKDKLPQIMFPRLVQNQDNGLNDIPNDDVPEDKKKDTPEAQNYKNACEEIDLITKCIKDVNDIPLEIANELSDKQKEVFIENFNIKFAECTQLEYDNFLREKTSMEYAIKQALEYVEKPIKKTKRRKRIKK